MRWMMFLLTGLILSGCGDNESRTAKEEVNSGAKIVNLKVGESESIPLNFDDEKTVETLSLSPSKDGIVAYQASYMNTIEPRVTVTGANKGDTVIYVTARSSDGRTQEARINAHVELDKTGHDNANGDPTDPTDPGDNNGTNPPIGGGDPNACVEGAFWSLATDPWHTTEGKDTPDRLGFIRSHTAGEDATLHILNNVNVTDPNNRLVLGTFTYTLSNQKELKFYVEIAAEMVGQKPNFYVGIGGGCFKGNIPTNANSIDKTIVPVYRSES